MQPLRQQVITLQRAVNDHMDKPSDPAAANLRREIQALEDDLQVGTKNPITIEDRVKKIIHILEGEAKANRIMNYEHLEMFKHHFQQVREALRRMG